MEATKRARLRAALIDIAELPADADAERLAAVNTQLRDAFFALGSETPDNLECMECVDIAGIGRHDAPSAFGLRLRHGAVSLTEVMNVAEGCPVPAQLLETFPALTQQQWDATLRMATMVFIAIESST